MKKILILGDMATSRYHKLTELEPLINTLRTIYSVEIREDYPQITKADMAQYDLTINYIDNWQDRGTLELEHILCDYLKNGGRMLTLHNGIIVKSAPTLLEMHGGSFEGHAQYQTLKYERSDVNHPITMDMKPFSMMEEPYEFNLFEPLEMEIILSFTMEGNKFPAGWVKEIENGKMVYLAFGHDINTFQKQEVQELSLRAMEWLIFK